MTTATDIDAHLDEAKSGRFAYGVWAICALVLLLDGYDLSVISFMAPEFVKEFGFEPSSMGIVFAVSLIGVAIGGPVGGWIGDRYGRKVTIVVSCFLFGLATLAMLPMNQIWQFALCRFIVGLGLGGALSAAIALTAEFSPKRSRDRVLALVGTAVPLGAVLPGIMTATLVPTHGWEILAIVGGAIPVLLALLLTWKIPESPKFLAMESSRHPQLVALMDKIGHPISPDAVANITVSKPKASGSPVQLLDDGLKVITPLVWVLFFAGSMALYLVLSWLPLVAQSLGMTTAEAGRFSAIFASAGLLGGLAIAALIRWAGVALLPAMFILGTPFLLAFSFLDLTMGQMVLCVLIPGISVGAAQVACSATAGMLYPTEIRGTGVGWALSWGRLGAILGPLVGALVFALEMPPQQTFAFAAGPMILGAVAGLILTVLCYRRFGSLKVDDKAAVPA